MLIALTLLMLQAAPVGVAPGPLPQAEADRRVAERFADLDLNEDGTIERDEARARADFDATANAAITAAGRTRKVGDPRPRVDPTTPDPAQSDAWFATTDTDRDGRISRAELAQAMGATTELSPPM